MNFPPPEVTEFVSEIVYFIIVGTAGIIFLIAVIAEKVRKRGLNKLKSATVIILGFCTLLISREFTKFDVGYFPLVDANSDYWGQNIRYERLRQIIPPVAQSFVILSGVSGLALVLAGIWGLRNHTGTEPLTFSESSGSP